MSRRRATLVALGALLTLWAALETPAGAQQPTAVSIEIDGAISPATAGWLETALDDAAQDGTALVVVRLDTPGGLDASMRRMVQTIAAAPMPVVVYVSPQGARAASAGLFVTLAGDVAAMAPQTNIGAASPVTLGGGDPGETDDVLGRKVRNDAAAYVRALAEARGRNADLAERMVTEAVAVSAQRAAQEGLVDLVASSEDELLRRLDGVRTQGPGAVTLDTTGLALEHRGTPTIVEFQQILVNPTVAYLLLIAGMGLIVLEVLSPGLLGPGLFGAIALALGLYGTAQLPVTVVGVALLVAALVLIAAETQTGAGVLGVAGVVALVVGGLLLFDTDTEALAVSVPVAVAVGAFLGGLTLVAANRVMAARHARVRGGGEDLVGAPATVRTELAPTGQVYTHGALWRARPVEGLGEAPAVGEHVVVEAVEGLTLRVRPPREAERETPEEEQS